MCQAQVDVQVTEEICQPVPAAGGFDDSPVRAGELREVALELEGRVGDTDLFDDRALGPVGCDEAIAFVLVDAGVGTWECLPGRTGS